VAFGLATVVVLVQLAASGGAAAEPASSEAELVGRLACPAGDLILTRHSLRDQNARGRAASPEQAVGDDISRIYPNLPPSAFRRAAQTSDVVELAHERNGQRLVGVVAVVVGDGWLIEGLAACNSVLVEGGNPR
jgi:hypothetical protein